VAQLLTAPGQTLLVSMLNMPLREAFGLEAITLNTAYAAATIAASLPLVWIGRLTDRHGPRRMLIGVSLSFGAACLFTAAIVDVTMVFVAFFLLRFLGQGSLSMVSGHAVAMWFHRRLGRMERFRSVALFAAGAPLPAVTLWLMDAFGWRATWAFFGIVVGLTVSTLSWRWVVDRPESLGLELDAERPDPSRTESSDTQAGSTLRDALRERSYYVLALATALPPMIGTAVIFDIGPMLAARGLGAPVAALAVGVWSAAMAVLAIPVGHLVDRSPPSWLLAGGGVALTAGCGVLLVADATPSVVAAMLLLAVGQSLSGPTVLATTARYFGRRHHGAIRSSLARVGIIATGLGPFVFGWSQHHTGTHQAALLGFGAACVLVAAISSRLRPPLPAPTESPS
jgi:sugar phosphate permease